MHDWAIKIGLLIVVATHIYLLNGSLPHTMKKEHALFNLAAAGLIAYGVYA